MFYGTYSSWNCSYWFGNCSFDKEKAGEVKMSDNNNKDDLVKVSTAVGTGLAIAGTIGAAGLGVAAAPVTIAIGGVMVVFGIVQTLKKH